MKRLAGLAVMAVMFLALFVQVFAKEAKESLSPYFAVQGAGDVEAFPLLGTEVSTVISGMSAQTELKQIYKNDGKKTIEAVYVFPLGTHTAINAMRMKIGSRVIEAEIHKTETAKAIYDEAKQTGKTASLLEQKRPNVFQMSVANIMPGDKVEVIVSYCEALVPEEGVYEFMFPTVVGPRFTGESSTEDLKGKDNWAVSPYQHSGERPKYTFDLNLTLNSGIPVAKVWSTSHRVETDFSNNNSVKVALSHKEENAGNKDFILKYSLAGDRINSGVLLYDGDRENFFLAMIEPPAKVESSMIPPREYLFIMDVSGSMYGFPLDTSKKVIRSILSNLRGQDYFNIMFFAGSSDTLFNKPLPATKENRDRALKMIDGQQGGGGTEILAAFNKASGLPKKEGMSRIVVTLTDGYVSVEKEVFDLMEKKMGESNFFTFGIGTSVNRYLIEGMARMGKGEPFVVTGPDEADATANRFIEYIKSPVLTDIKVRYEGFDAYDVEPVSVPDLFAQRPITIMGKYKNASGRIIITGRTVNGNFDRVIDVRGSGEGKGNESLKYIWARERIARLADYAKVGQDVKEEVTMLGLRYNLMTEYTSFVAVDKVVRDTGEVVTVKQPLPLPEGVSDYAVGGAAQAKSVSTNYLMAPSASGFGMARKGKAAPVAAMETLAEDKDEKEDIKQAASVTGDLFITDGNVPSGYTLDEASTAVMSKVKKELESFMKNNGLAKLEVEIKVENGKVKEVSMKNGSINGLDKILKKVVFDGFSGTIGLTFEIM